MITYTLTLVDEQTYALANVSEITERTLTLVDTMRYTLTKVD